ncbi:MAG: Sapep family Mn(2+)-dependent dipeptidase, partial [Eggerthellaceae bacterium]|nr:Sapep family Mn(2+)-dependent dipeptidase [Eggerthellaceae bacterium]
MVDRALYAAIDAFIEENWEQVVADIGALVRIPSVEELGKAGPGAPFGPGPAAALKEALAISERLGFQATDCEGHIGFADLPGKRETQFGIIGHMDVVPAGNGWDFEPFAVTRHEGYLVGRGCVDDKGPTVVALYAAKFLSEHYGAELPYTVRVIFGANEESGMRDVTYYRERFADPAFVVTPDADFPVCYGEKGGFDGRVTSKPLAEDAMILEFTGGMAMNAVPSLAQVLIRACADDLPPADRITIEDSGGNALLTATGIGGHASLPEGTVNAIGLLVEYLLEHGLYTQDERPFLELQHDLLSAHDGSGVGLQTSDEAFGPLTLIGGTVGMTEDRRIAQTIDIR